MIRPIKLALLFALLAPMTIGLETGCKPKVDTSLATENAENPNALFENGILLLKTPDKNGVIDYSTAYQRFDKSAGLFNDNAKKAKAHFNAAWVAEVLGQNGDAEKHYRAAYDADNSYEKAMFSLARVLTGEGKHQDAVAIYRGYVEKNPEKLDVRNDLVAALSAAGMYEEAVKEAQAILLKDPKNATVYRNLSSMYYAQGNYGMSQLCAEKSLSLNEGDPGTYNNLGVTLLLQKDEPGAVEKFKTAIKLDSDNFEANLNLGYVALDSGDYKLALDCFTKASTSNPSSVDAKMGLAVALRGAKEFDKAEVVYDEIIKADPQSEIAYFNAATLEEKYKKDYVKAKKYLQAYVDAKSGTIGPTHEVFTRMARVEESQKAEEARIAEEKRLAQEKKEREERALAALKELQDLVTATEAKVKACDPMVQEEVAMMIETAKQVIESKDTGMAQDTKSMFTDYYGPMVDACAGGAPTEEPAAPAAPEGGTPAEGGAPAPAPEGGAPAPAPEGGTPAPQ